MDFRPIYERLAPHPPVTTTTTTARPSRKAIAMYHNDPPILMCTNLGDGLTGYHPIQVR